MEPKAKHPLASPMEQKAPASFGLPHGTKSSRILWSPPWNKKLPHPLVSPFLRGTEGGSKRGTEGGSKGGREGDLKGDFDLLYFITAQSAVNHI